MIKYDDTVSSQTTGQPIYGAQVTVLNAQGLQATIYSDEAGTIPLSQPILTDQSGYFSFYIDDGRYNVVVMAGQAEIARTNITMVDTLTLKDRALLVPQNEDAGTLPPAGDRAGLLLGFAANGAPTALAPNSFEGPTGPANSTYTSLAALKAAPITNSSYIFAPPNGSDGGATAGTFVFQAGDFTGRSDVVKLDSTPLNQGALVRPPAEQQFARNIVGLVGDGSDQTSALAALYGPNGPTTPHLAPGVYLTTANLTISKPTRFDRGAIIRVPAGVKLTVAADIDARQFQIFDIANGDDLTIVDGALHQIIPDWFGANVVVGGSNTIYGKFAGTKLTGSDAPIERNYAAIYGYRAGQQLTKTNETALFGTFAGSSLSDGLFQTGIGYGALRGKEDPEGSGNFRRIDGDSNTALGCATLQDGIVVTRNLAAGAFALKELQYGTDNTALGTLACRVSQNGRQNTIVGSNAAYYLGSTGGTGDTELNVGVGYAALGNPNNKQGSYSVAVGGLAGYTMTTGRMVTLLGYNTGPVTEGEGFVVNAICVGFSARCRKSNSITIGNSLINDEDRTLIGSSAAQIDTTLGPRKLVIGDTAPIAVISIDGEANGIVAAPVGSMAGSKNGKLYFKAGGESTNTGWREVAFV